MHAFVTPPPLAGGQPPSFMQLGFCPLARLCALVCLWLISVRPSLALPVFPGAQGYGTETVAGRGTIGVPGSSTVYVVTSLNDSNPSVPGELRYGVESVSGPRVIVFEVGGVIELRRALTVRQTHPFLTIAGQTAPYPGITLKNAGINVQSHDVLVQHIAIRPGARPKGAAGSGWDNWEFLPPYSNRKCIGIDVPGGYETYNVVFDHVTCSWGTDENVTIGGGAGDAVRDITISNSLISEALRFCGHPDVTNPDGTRIGIDGHSAGLYVYKLGRRVSVARNLFAFIRWRNPKVAQAGTDMRVVNNFIYAPGEWQGHRIQIGESVPSHTTAYDVRSSIVGNVTVLHQDPTRFPSWSTTKYGANSTQAIDVHANAPANVHLYLDNNHLWHPTYSGNWVPSFPNDNPALVHQGTVPNQLSADPLAVDSVTLLDASWSPAQIENHLLGNSGARPAERDAVDTRLVGQIAGRTLRDWMDDPSEYASHSGHGADGYSTATGHRPLVLPDYSTRQNDDDGDGYTNLEEWLHQMAAAVESAANRPPVALAGPDLTVVVHGEPTALVALDGSRSFDYDGGALTFAWSWPGGSATGPTPTIALPVGVTSITLTVTDATGATGTDVISITVEDRPRTIELAHLQLGYTGYPLPATVITRPEQLAVDVRYQGSATPPIYPGSYTVTATITTPGYNESVTGILQIEPTVFVRHAPILNGLVDGSVQLAQPASFVLNGSAAMASDLLMPGSPTVQLNGAPLFAGTIDGPGAADPGTHQLRLNHGAMLRHLVRRVDAPVWPTVSVPLPPIGTRNVVVNAAGAPVSDFATVRNLTLNSGAGAVAVPPGNYGSFTANNGSTFRLGVAGTSVPESYSFQSLNLNGDAALEVVGPVELTLASGGNFNQARIGEPAHPEWLRLRVASGGLALNGGARFYGTAIAPAGTVTVNGGALWHGRMVADRVTVNGNGIVRDPAERNAPAVQVTAPLAAARLVGRVTVAATASDDTEIAGVQFFLNGVKLGTEDTAAPYAVEWDTLPYSDGAHTLVAVARDVAGNTAESAPVAVVVANAVFDTFETSSFPSWISDGAGSWGVTTQNANRVLRQTNATVVANRAFLDSLEWGDQLVEADVRLNAVSGNNRFFGVVARYRNPNNYYYFVLRTNHTAELKRLSNGIAANITPPRALPFTVTPGTSYRLTLEAVGARLRGFVNGQLLMEGTDATFASGRAALLTFFSDVSFDDVHADPTPYLPVLVAENFESGLPASWQPAGGAWSVVSDADSPRLRQDAAGEARIVCDTALGTATLLEAQLRFVEQAGAAGLAVRYQDAANHYAVRLRSDGQLALERTVAGQVTVLASAATTMPAGGLTLRLHAVGDSLKVYADGNLHLQAIDSTFAAGRLALFTTDARAEFDDVTVRAP